MPARRPIAVAFDVNGTLFALDGLGDAFEDAGLPGPAIDLWFARTLASGFALAASDTFATFTGLGRSHLRRILRSFGLASDESTLDRLLGTLSELEAHEDVELAFQRLRAAGARVVTLTNGSAELSRRLLERNGLSGFVERCFDAAEAGRWKPRPEPYRHVAAELGIEAGALALVAVHAWDVHGAKRAGLVGAWVSRLEGELLAEVDEPDVRANSLVEAVDALLALPTV